MRPDHLLAAAEEGAAGQGQDTERSLAELRAAVAEAWHVDGRFREAAALWEELFAAGHEPPLTSFQAATAYLSCGDGKRGHAWLDRARSLGAPAGELLFASGRHGWGRGDEARAIADLEAAAQAAPGSGKAANALGVLHWKRGDRARARACFERALARDPGEADAITNLVVCRLDTLDREAAEDMLARAAMLRNHRVEPFVIHSRVCRRAGDREAMQDALARARLRARVLAPGLAGASLLAPRRAGRATVTGTITASGIEARIVYEWPAGAAPRALVVNAGYEIVQIQGRAAEPLEGDARDAAQARHPAPVRVYPLPAAAHRVEVRLRGMPLPPCVRLEPDEIELDGRSAWLPVPREPVWLRWALALALPTGLEAHASSGEPEVDGIGLLAISARPEVVMEMPGDAGTVDRVRALSRAEPALARYAARLAAITAQAWRAQIGLPARAVPPLIVVDRPRSTFCYARPGYLRVPSGLLARPDQIAQVCHEVGHLWWGTAARFTREDEWLGEALAEYSYHLLEERGHRIGLPRAALAAALALDGGRLARMGMARLARESGPAAAFVLRTKGGYLMAMLCRVMGPAAFARLLRTAFAAGTATTLDVYGFFALASWIHGASLRWFANQWIHADASMRLSIADVAVAPRAGGHALWFTARCTGPATPGGPVHLSVTCADGAVIRLARHLDLGHARIHTTTPAMPVQVDIDPDRHWFAETQGGSP